MYFITITSPRLIYAETAMEEDEGRERKWENKDNKAENIKRERQGEREEKVKMKKVSNDIERNSKDVEYRKSKKDKAIVNERRKKD
jgi:hypothetical protein